MPSTLGQYPQAYVERRRAQGPSACPHLDRAHLGFPRRGEDLIIILDATWTQRTSMINSFNDSDSRAPSLTRP